MNRTLDVALAKRLKELLGTSGKRIAVYFKQGVEWPQVVTVYQNQAPPTVHPHHPDFSFAGWLDFKTGEVKPDLEVDIGLGGRAGAGAPLWRVIVMAVLGLLVLLAKLAFFCVIGVVWFVGIFTGHSIGGHSRR